MDQRPGVRADLAVSLTGGVRRVAWVGVRVWVGNVWDILCRCRCCGVCVFVSALLRVSAPHSESHYQLVRLSVELFVLIGYPRVDHTIFLICSTPQPFRLPPTLPSLLSPLPAYCLLPTPSPFLTILLRSSTLTTLSSPQLRPPD